MKCRNRIILILSLACAASSGAFAAPTPPAPIPGGYQYGFAGRVIGEREQYAYFAEALAAEQTGRRESRSVGLGSYYQINEAFKLGVMIHRSFGIRHDEDWASNNGKWAWIDSRHRGETLVAVDATAKHLVDFLPGRDWVAEFKVRYILNRYNDDRTLFVRPGLTYFYLRDAQLIANFFAQIEIDLPLNYATESISEKWLYFGALYHASESLDIGPTLTLGWQTWGRPSAYANKNGALYSITTQTTTLGLSAIFRL